ncbi:MAG: 2-amino-4-hydroxy-6-hydroxymethyldihydropteridine diphosphokinase [Candidatus Peribacteraceae bacterium]|nr:2-amino-4-hydroxy-6-hydroxymethyldihydropteridine diphosphokinase [Candidatus Peribacteraceae bacterium]
MTQIAIGLGSNIDPQANLKAAADLLRKQWPTIRLSSVYESAPVERTDQSVFLNAVAIIETEESAHTILDQLRLIEQQLHKSPPHRFGPRTIDLDLLLAGDQIVPDRILWMEAKKKNDPQDQAVYIPHLRMDERRFVLEPLIELHSADMHPVFNQSIRSLWEKSVHQECTKTTIQL